MTVKELVEHLSTLPQDAKVFTIIEDGLEEVSSAWLETYETGERFPRELATRVVVA